MKKRIHLISLALVILLGAGWLISQTVYAASTVTVTGYGDQSDVNPGDGLCDTNLGLPGEQCSLRAAIEELNAQGPDVTPHRIEFGIVVGSGPFTITVGSELPDITVPVEIDGSTQPGATCPTNNAPANLSIVLDGSALPLFGTALTLGPGSDGSLIRGLAIGNFSIALSVESDGNDVICNHIGVQPDGVTNIPNTGYAVVILGDNNTIGGQGSHTRRNVISGNGIGTSNGGMNIIGASNIVRNNFIGTTANGLNPLGNGTGIFVSSGVSNNTIGGTAPLARNVISGNNFAGINMSGPDNVILGNLIGVGRDGVTAIPNDIGIKINSDSNIIGGVANGEANIIANNLVYGIVVDGTSPPVGNEIRGNMIYGSNTLGIDLGLDGVDTNDIGDLDTGPNGHQNYPVLHGISGANILSSTLSSMVNTAYTVDIYRSDSCNSSGFGEGQELIYSGIYQTELDGDVDFDLNITPWNLSPGDYLTALATDPNGNTSEFSACLVVPGPPPTPTPTPSPTNTPTTTPSPTATSSPTATPSSTPTPTATATSTSSPDKEAYIPAIFN